MLDRFHQATALRDMMVVVRTKSSQSMIDYNCNGWHIITQSSEPREVNFGRPLENLVKCVTHAHDMES